MKRGVFDKNTFHQGVIPAKAGIQQSEAMHSLNIFRFPPEPVPAKAGAGMAVLN